MILLTICKLELAAKVPTFTLEPFERTFGGDEEIKAFSSSPTEIQKKV
jgi:hypothetical protein